MLFLKMSCFNWFKDPQPFPHLSQNSKLSLCGSKRNTQLRWGCKREGEALRCNEGVLFLWLDEKKEVCVLPDFGSAGGHTEDYAKRQVLGKRERRVMVLFVYPHPTFLADITFAIE